MCLSNLFSPKIPKVKPPAPPPIPRAQPEPPPDTDPARPLRGEDEKARVTYGTKRDELTAEGNKREAKQSTIPLNRAQLADPGNASQGGVGGSV